MDEISCSRGVSVEPRAASRSPLSESLDAAEADDAETDVALTLALDGER